MAIFDLIAVLDGAHSVAPSPELQMIAQQGLTAVLSCASRPMMRLPQSRKDHLNDVATRLRWQEACMHLGTLLPARQGSALSAGGTIAFLAANHPDLTAMMRRFSGQVQVQVTVSWAQDRVLNQFRDAPELAPIFAGGKVTATDLRLAVQQLALRMSLSIGAELAGVVTDISPLPMTDGIVWNGAVLVAEKALPDLDRAVEAVDAIWSDGLSIRQIGPAPIGSFATLDLDHISAMQIDRAVDKFGADITMVDRATLRRSALMKVVEDADGTRRDAIRAQARIAEAAIRLKASGITTPSGFALCRLTAESQATPLQQLAVA